MIFILIFDMTKICCYNNQNGIKNVIIFALNFFRDVALTKTLQIKRNRCYQNYFYFIHKTTQIFTIFSHEL